MPEPVGYDVDGRPRDWRGLVIPHHIRATALLRTVPGMIDQFAPIPDAFWSSDVDDGDEVAVVSCPCGEEPRVPLNSMRACECSRVFFHAGRDVRAANRPGQYTDSKEPVDLNAIE